MTLFATTQEIAFPLHFEGVIAMAINNRPDLIPNPTFVYFARSDVNGLIKIGFSKNPTKRLAGVQTFSSEPITLLLTVVGDMDTEKEFHQRFAKCHHRLEWFREEGPLRAFLEKRGKASPEVSNKSRKQPKPAVSKKSAGPVKKIDWSKNFAGVPRSVGYARVSTPDQSIDMQVTALIKAGVDIEQDLFHDKLTATNSKRPGLNLMKKHLQPGDTLYVYSVSRLYRNARLLLNFFEEMRQKTVTIKSLTEGLDLTTSHGRMTATILAAVDQGEVERVSGRTTDGMAERMRQGVVMGRPRIVDEAMIAQMQTMRDDKIQVTKIAAKFGVKPATVYAKTTKPKS